MRREDTLKIIHWFRAQITKLEKSPKYDEMRDKVQKLRETVRELEETL